MSEEYNTIEQINTRISKMFQENLPFIRDPQVNQTINDFTELGNNATTEDLNNLRINLNNYMDNNLGSVGVNITRYDAINDILVVIENEYSARYVGSTKINAGINGESFDGGLTYEPTITSFIGSSSIANIGATLTDAIGNTPLSSIILLNVTTQAGTSISSQINLLANAVSNAIGTNVPLLIKGPLSLYSCNETYLGPEIYSIQENPSLVDAINIIYACATWDISSPYNGLAAPDVSLYCEFPANVSACQSYFVTGFPSAGL